MKKLLKKLQLSYPLNRNERSVIKQQIFSAFEEKDKEIEELKEKLSEAIELVECLIGYCPDGLREKRMYDDDLKKLKDREEKK